MIYLCAINTMNYSYFIMKKVLSLFIVSLLAISSLSAQKIVDYQSSQARILDVKTNAYVLPKVVELQILSEKRIKEEINYTNAQIDAMKGDEGNIRANATFKVCEKYDADVLVGGLFDIRTNPTHNGFIVTVLGYPAKFVKWRNYQSTDKEWINLSNGVTDGEKTKAIVK